MPTPERLIHHGFRVSRRQIDLSTNHMKEVLNEFNIWLNRLSPFRIPQTRWDHESAMEMEFCPAGLPVAPIPERLVSQRVSLLQHLNKQHQTPSNTIRNKDISLCWTSLSLTPFFTHYHLKCRKCLWTLLHRFMLLVPYQPDRALPLLPWAFISQREQLLGSGEATNWYKLNLIAWFT